MLKPIYQTRLKGELDNTGLDSHDRPRLPVNLLATGYLGACLHRRQICVRTQFRFIEAQFYTTKWRTAHSVHLRPSRPSVLSPVFPLGYFQVYGRQYETVLICKNARLYRRMVCVAQRRTISGRSNNVKSEMSMNMTWHRWVQAEGTSKRHIPFFTGRQITHFFLPFPFFLAMVLRAVLINGFPQRIIGRALVQLMASVGVT
ncbi:hypothetical protein BDR07DRAFT_1374422 [Suillus spraguei]|nr:hypothetical protein BDR07DRAFT_1374422 [Suillus spraguei]